MDYTDDDIRKLLDEAAPGPWEIAGYDGELTGVNGPSGYDSELGPIGGQLQVYGGPDARLIAAAPTLARLLLAARAELAAVRAALDAASAPLTVERGGSGPDSGTEVEATTEDRVRWLAEECAGLWLDLRERPAGALGALREARPDTRIEVLYHPHADPGDGSGWVCSVGDRNYYGDNTLAGALAAAVRAECGE